MNPKIVESVGFAEAHQNYQSKICPICKTKINMTDFIDELSIKEYRVSGLCQKCQNDVFGEDDV